jgi:ribosomal protein S27E
MANSRQIASHDVTTALTYTPLSTLAGEDASQSLVTPTGGEQGVMADVLATIAGVAATAASGALTGRDASGALVTPTGGVPATLAVTLSALEAAAASSGTLTGKDVSGALVTPTGGVSATLAATLATLEAEAAAALAKANTGVQTINGQSPTGSGAITIAVPPALTAGANITISGNVISATGGGGGGAGSYSTPAYLDFTETNFAAGTSGAKSAAGTITINASAITSYSHAFNALMKPIPSTPIRYIMKFLNPSIRVQANWEGLYVESGTGALFVLGYSTAGYLQLMVQNDYAGTGQSVQETLYLNTSSYLWISAVVNTSDLVGTTDRPAAIYLEYSLNGVDWYLIGAKTPFGAGATYAKIGFGLDTFSTLDNEWDAFNTHRYITVEQWIESVPSTELG